MAPKKAPSRYTHSQLEALWISAGGPPKDADVAAAIAEAESGGDPNAENHNTDGSTDLGLWQINTVHGKLATKNVAGNVRAAVQLHKNRKGFADWVTYNTGAYRKFLKGQQQGEELGKFYEKGSGIPGVDPVIGAVGDVAEAAASVPKMLSYWFSQGGILRLIKILAGLAFIAWATKSILYSQAVPKP